MDLRFAKWEVSVSYTRISRPRLIKCARRTGSKRKSKALLRKTQARWHKLRVKKRNKAIDTFAGKKSGFINSPDICVYDIAVSVNSSFENIDLPKRESQTELPQATSSFPTFPATADA